MLMIVYITVIVLAYLYYVHHPLLFLALLLPMNLLLLFLAGNYFLSAIFFPYANYFIQKRLDSQLNKTYALEFVKLAENVH